MPEYSNNTLIINSSLFNTIKGFQCRINENYNDEVAFLQHSSGTTSLKKGVPITHNALSNQINVYSQAISLKSDDVIISWLPLYHDMGLITCFFNAVIKGYSYC